MVLLSREELLFRRRVVSRIPKSLPNFPKALLIVHEYAE